MNKLHKHNIDTSKCLLRNFVKIQIKMKPDKNEFINSGSNVIKSFKVSIINHLLFRF